MKKYRATKIVAAFGLAALAVSLAPAAFAEPSDPIAAITNFSDFIFTVIRLVGIIIAAWGIVQFALALKSHDPQQRSQGIISAVVGLLIIFTREILNLVVGGGV